MTIPEGRAAGASGGGRWAAAGEVFVLDMGEPVRIVDLATRPGPPVGPGGGARHRHPVHRRPPGREALRGALLWEGAGRADRASEGAPGPPRAPVGRHDGGARSAGPGRGERGERRRDPRPASAAGPRVHPGRKRAQHRDPAGAGPPPRRRPGRRGSRARWPAPSGSRPPRSPRCWPGSARSIRAVRPSPGAPSGPARARRRCLPAGAWASSRATGTGG